MVFVKHDGDIKIILAFCKLITCKTEYVLAQTKMLDLIKFTTLHILLPLHVAIAVCTSEQRGINTG